MTRLLDAIKAKARSIMFTILVAIGILQMVVGVTLDVITYGLALGVVWVALKLGVGK